MKIRHFSKVRGFTLVEIMIVVAIIGILAAMAVPNFVKARASAQKSGCVNNLRQIEGAKEQWALEKKKSAGAPSSGSEVDGYIKAGTPKCPAGGGYVYGAVDTSPTCTIAGHSI